MNSTILKEAEELLKNVTASFNRPIDKDFLTLENPVFGNFMFWTGLLAIKMLLMSMLSAYHGLVTKTDSDGANPPAAVRVAGAHRNDLENILPYFTIGLLYVCVNPPPLLATILFRIATIFRFFHTFVYAIYPIPQPARLICFIVHYLITFYMAIHIMVIAIKFI